MKRTISCITTVLLLCVAVLEAAPGTAYAQAKPALVRSVDEGGRQIYRTGQLQPTSNERVRH